MGKKKSAEAYQDVKELNWEETEPENLTGGSVEQDSGSGNQDSDKDPGISFMSGVLMGSVGAKAVGDMLLENVMKVEPEIRENNPVWHWALCDDHCTFVFRDGRKVTIPFTESYGKI